MSERTNAALRHLKSCKGCQRVQPLAEFYLRSAEAPEGPRRARCKTCEASAASHRRRNGPSVISELIQRGTGDPDALSERALEMAYTDEPMPPALIDEYRRRIKAAEAERKRQERLCAERVRPMRFACAGVRA